MPARKHATTAILAAVLAISAFSAQAATVLTFAESGINPPSAVTFVDNGNGTTSLSTSIGVTISSIAGPLAGTTPITDAMFLLTGQSTNFATTALLGTTTYYEQTFAGTYSIIAPECGTTCLTGTWVDLLTGPVGGFALSLTASTPPASNLTMISTTIPANLLATPRGMALSKTALTAAVALDCTAIQGCTLASTTANVSGTFAAAPAVVPEPLSSAVLGAGMAALGFIRQRRAA